LLQIFTADRPWISYVFCPRCNREAIKGSANCAICGESLLRQTGTDETSPRRWLAWLGVQSNLALHFRRKGYLSLQRYGHEYIVSPTLIRDVFDSDISQKWRSEGVCAFWLLPSSAACALIFLLRVGFWFESGDTSILIGFDGVAVYRTSKMKAWAFLALNNNLPPSERFKMNNIFLLGILFSESTPNVPQLFKILVDDLDVAVDPFIVEDFSGNEISCRVRTLAMVTDMEALWLATNMEQFGPHPCSTCGQVKTSVPRAVTTQGGKNEKQILPLLSSTQGSQPKEANSFLPHLHPPYRTFESWLFAANAATELEAPVNGIKGHSDLMRLRYFPFPEGILPDFMHSGYLHVVPEFRKYWLHKEFQVRVATII